MIQAANEFDGDGKPRGGWVRDTGLAVDWQDGPLGETGERNGAFVEDLLEAAKQRLEWYQTTGYASDFNRIAIDHIQTALLHLNLRTADREARGVEGTYTV